MLTHRDQGIVEGDLVGTVSDADTDAVEELFNDVYPKLAGWVRNLVDDDDIAHEIASEAFTRLLSRWTREKRPHSYLHLVAADLVRNHRRKADRELPAIHGVTTGAAPTSRRRSNRTQPIKSLKRL